MGPGAGSSNTAPRITFSYAPASIQGLAESTGVARDSGQSSGHQISAMPAQEPSSTASGESRGGRGGGEGGREAAAATSAGGVRCYESRCAAPQKACRLRGSYRVDGCTRQGMQELPLNRFGCLLALDKLFASPARVVF